MRAPLLIAPFLALGACATVPHHAATETPTGSYAATYDVDAATLVPLVIDATHSQHMRVAVVEAESMVHPGSARFVVTSDLSDGAAMARTALVIHVAQANGTDRFRTCFGMCRTEIEVTPVGLAGGNGGDEARHQAADLMVAIGDRTSGVRADR